RHRLAASASFTMHCATYTIAAPSICTRGPAPSTIFPNRPTPCLSATKSLITPVFASSPELSRDRQGAEAKSLPNGRGSDYGQWRFSMSTVAAIRTLPERALEMLRRAGNPFRNYFARNPDDEVCALYHVPELFAREREQLLSVVDLYRYAPTTHSEVVPVLGSKGSGKTHLLHSIKHGPEGAWQLLVTPG